MCAAQMRPTILLACTSLSYQKSRPCVDALNAGLADMCVLGCRWST